MLVKTLSEVGLVGCVKQKKKVRSRAKDLYTSELFAKARRYAESHYDKWFILSAKYHLVESNDYIDTYDETLNEKTRAERKDWFEVVFEQIRDILPSPSSCTLYFHAGEKYREFLIRLLLDAGYSVRTPLEGLRIGKQLSWYKGHRA